MPIHPLEPLSSSEIQAVAGTMLAQSILTPTGRIISIMLKEPFKALIYALPRASAPDREIENTDAVFWYTFGHTHIPRPEDCPVMPTAYIGFLLKPNGFFDENPANDVPPSEPANAQKS